MRMTQRNSQQSYVNFVKLYNFGCSYCVVTGCSQDRKEAQQQQQLRELEFDMLTQLNRELRTQVSDTS